MARRTGSVSGKDRLHEKVKTAKGRKISSTRWLQRQLNDPYITQARRDGYRSRAAYKLLEMDDRFGFLRPDYCVLDLGCAPGSWLQVVVERIKARQGKGFALGLDVLEVAPVAGAQLVTMDFLADDAPQLIEQHIRAYYEAKGEVKGGEAKGKKARAEDYRIDTILSDMAANTIGHRQTDHLRIMALAEAVAEFAFANLKPNGTLCLKLFQGGAHNHLLNELKANFTRVVHMKPKASRKTSPELYLVATGFKGANRGNNNGKSEGKD